MYQLVPAMIIRKNALDFLPGDLVVTAGTIHDYRTLERFHYVPGRPATCAAVWTARYTDRPGTIPRVVGVVVLSYPSAFGAARHRAFNLRAMPLRERLRWANANLRTISRVVVHPQFRSIGLSGVLIAHACANAPTRYLEACARMGHVHPMFERAGMHRIDPAEVDAPVYYWCACSNPTARLRP
jgi:hypothetical protein